MPVDLLPHLPRDLLADQPLAPAKPVTTGSPAVDAMVNDYGDAAKGGLSQMVMGAQNIGQAVSGGLLEPENIAKFGQGALQIPLGALRYLGSPLAPLQPPIQRATDASIGRLTTAATGSPYLGQVASNTAAAGANALIFGGANKLAEAPEVIPTNATRAAIGEHNVGSPAAQLSAQAARQPVPVTLTTGQLTGDPAQMLLEDRARQGSLGSIAQRRMQAADDARRQALFGNLQTTQANMGGSETPIEPGQGMATAQNAVVSKADRAMGAVNDAYNQARRSGDASVNQQAWTQGAQDVRERVSSSFNPSSIPKTWSILDDFFKPGFTQGTSEPLVSKIFQTRQQLASLQGEGGAEGAAASQAKAALDKWTTGLNSEDLSGDPASINRWRNAISQRAKYGQTFERGIVGDMIERDPKAGNRLTIDPSEAAHRILGDTPQAMANKQDISRNIAQLRDALGPDSPEWNQVRQEMFSRLVKPATGTPLQGGGNEFSSTNFVKSWDAFNKQNPQLASLILKPDEMAQMQNFRDIVDKTIVKPGGRQLGSGAALTQLFSSASPFVKRLLNTVAQVPFVSDLVHVPAAMRIGKAAVGALPRRPVLMLPPPATPVLAAATSAMPGTALSTIRDQIGR